MSTKGHKEATAAYNRNAEYCNAYEHERSMKAALDAAEQHVIELRTALATAADDQVHHVATDHAAAVEARNEARCAPMQKVHDCKLVPFRDAA